MYNNVFRTLAAGLLIVCLNQSSCFAEENPAVSNPPAAPKVYSTSGSLDGVTFTVDHLKRNTNGTLTLSLKIQGTQGKPVRRDSIGFSGESPWNKYFTLLDMANKKRYSILEDSNAHHQAS